MTTMSEALKKAGLDPCIAQLDIALAMFINHGRSESEVHRLVSAAYAKARKASSSLPSGQMGNAFSRSQLLGQANALVPIGQPPPASPRQPQSDEGLSAGAITAMDRLSLSPPQSEANGRRIGAAPAISAVPAASPPKRGEGQGSVAGKARQTVPSSRPNNGPTPLARKVMAHVAKTLATVTINDYMVIGDDGKPRPMKRGELRAQAKKHRKKAMLYEATAEYLDRVSPGGDQAANVVDLIDVPTYEQLAQEVVYA